MNGIRCLCRRLADLPRRAGALLAPAATPAMGGASGRGRLVRSNHMIPSDG
jgi:hypothetical protein